MSRTEKRWFKVRGYFPNPGLGKGVKPTVEVYQITVTVTGSYHDMMREAAERIMKLHGFFVTSLLSHSLKKECL